MDDDSWNILLVDDDEDDYVLVRDMLSQLGGRRFELRWAPTCEAALEALERDPPHAALVDYRLGARSGIDLVREAAARGCTCPLILLTGQGSYEVDLEAMQAGAADYLVKDHLGVPLLERAIRYAIERKRAEEEREKLQAQLLQSHKMEAVGRLAAGLAHDFNNLLTAIIGFADLLQMDMSPGDPRQQMLASIQRSGQRAAYLVNQLLAFASKQMIAPRSLNLNHILAEMVGTLRRTLGEGIELTTRCQPDLWLVEMDPDQLRQVVNGLATNARDAMPGGGKLMLETANVTLGAEEAKTRPEVLPADYVLLEVSDTGAGISEEAIARIFEPFFITSREVADGKGLRLAAVYGAVKQNKGHVYVESQEGRGTTFKVYLPRREE
jgi:signal transduction histidine kinase